MTHDTFHPQFQGLLDNFLVDSRQYFLRSDDIPMDEFFAQRPLQITNSLNVNASVWRGPDGLPVYRISAGAVAAIIDITHSLAATPKFYPEIALTGKRLNLSRARGPLDFLNYNFLLGDGDPLPLIPQLIIYEDVMRNQIQHLLQNLCMRFLIMHEQAHVTCGHLHYIFGARNNVEFMEVDDQISELPLIERQALELEADGFAYTALLEICLSDGHKVVVEPLDGHFSERLDWLRFVSTATFCVLLLLSISDTICRSEDQKTHPAAQVRMLNLLQVYNQFVHQHMGEQDSYVMQSSMINLFGDIQQIAILLGVEPPHFESYQEWMAKNENYSHATCIELDMLSGVLIKIQDQTNNIII